MDRDRDRELLDRAGQGDRAAFGELYERHHAVVWRFVVHWMGSFTYAEDLVADTFLEVLKDPGRFDPDREAAFDTYLCSIASHLILKLRRRMQWEIPSGRPDESDQVLLVLNDWFEHQINLALDLEGAARKLPERQQDVLRMSDREEWKLHEIGDTYGLKLPAVKSLLHRARAGMRKWLGPRAPQKDTLDTLDTLDLDHVEENQNEPFP